MGAEFDLREAKTTFLECWPPELVALSMPTRIVPLDDAEVRLLAFGPRVFRPWPTADDPSSLTTLLGKIDGLLRAFRGCGFVRLGSGSAKDSLIFQTTKGRIRRAMTAVKAIQGSPRLQRHLRLHLAAGEPVFVAVRQWRRIRRWSELRCFVFDGRLVGVTQLNLDRSFRQLEYHRQHILTAIAEDFMPRLRAACHLPSVVADVFLAPPLSAARQRNAPPFRVVLTELNPASPLTDGGLFRWDLPGDFDGSFRLLLRPLL